MLSIPALKAHLRAVVIPGEGVMLLTDDGGKVLHGAVYEKLVPLIDGRRTADEIVDALAGQVEVARVYFALGRMEALGHLAPPAPDVPPAIAGFWHAVGADAGAVQDAHITRHVAVLTVGEVGAAPLHAALAVAALTEVAPERADLWIVLADDYLRPELKDINDAALTAGRSWLLARAGGREQWLGPYFQPGTTGCWQCLQRRLSRNRAVHNFAVARLGDAGPGETGCLTPRVGLAVAHAATCHAVALEAALILAGLPSGMGGRVISRDWVTQAQQTHILTRNPLCSACGRPAAPAARPFELSAGRAAFQADGGHRIVAPEATLAAFHHLVSPITGLVGMVQPVTPPGETLAHVYAAGFNAARPIRCLRDLKRNLRSAAAGKGVSEAQAKVSALCEALERCSGEIAGDEVRVRRAWKDWEAGEAIHPNTVMGYSDAQFADREAQNAKGSVFNITPMPLPDDLAIDWTPLWSLSGKRHKYLPTQLVYYGVDGGRDSPEFHAVGCSNGNAAGNTREEALLQGFFELVERDGVALWWYNRLRRRGVDTASFDDPYLPRIAAHYREKHGRETWALDLTTDLGIPVFVALSRAVDQPQERVLFGLGCHLDARIALQRAYAEMNQMLGLSSGEAEGKLEDEETLHWLRTATLANQPYLAPDPGQVPARRDDFPVQHSGDFLTDIHHCLSILDRAGLEMLVLDQTREELGLPVVKVVVPGLRHFWARFAPGRLYDVPMRMGWLDRPLAEADLNPVPIFI
ncbi:TOMM precursor leader peptide-binding protein [Niveispirillum sp. KHB5.9]|uniref:TOMM precursor leader peptide-binding protein n=1 Tax=Niveispirillum sp. KHB5.9 TaxID=3400269 RepID=UPI003A8741A3